MLLKNKASLFLVSFFLAFNLSAQEAEFDFNIAEETQEKQGFDTEETFDFDEALEEEKNGFPLRGKISFDLGYQFGKPKRWLTLGPYSQLIFDYQHDSGQYYSELTIRNNYAFQIEKDSNSIQNRYQLDALIREAYWKKAFGNITLTLGKAIVTWGKADLAPVIDIISPIDNTGSLFAKPEEIKTGQNVIKLDWYQGKNEYNFIYVPKAANNIQIEFGHPYTASPLATTNNIKQKQDEWAFRWNQTHDKWEVSVVTGNVHQRDPIIFGTEQTWLKNEVLGFGFNYSQDPFLWKLEALYLKDRPMQKLDFTGSKAKDDIKGIIGFDYAHQKYGNWTLEYSGERPIDKDSTVVLGEGSKVTAVYWSDSFLKDDLTTNIVFMNTGNNIGNHLIRGGISYKLDDDWTLTSQLSFFNSTGSEPLLKLLSNFDRFDLSLNYNFDLAN